MVVPIVTVATASNGATLVAPPTQAYSLCALKSNYQHLIHQIEIVANGKVVNDMQPFVSVFKNFKMLSELSATDLESTNLTLGLSTVLDNDKSVRWTVSNGVTGGATGQPGIGLCNNLPFPISGIAAGPVAVQNNNQHNEAIYNRVSRTLDTTNGSYNNLTGSPWTSGTVAGTP